jgi:hypothetical protein
MWPPTSSDGDSDDDMPGFEELPAESSEGESDDDMPGLIPDTPADRWKQEVVCDQQIVHEWEYNRTNAEVMEVLPYYHCLLIWRIATGGKECSDTCNFWRGASKQLCRQRISLSASMFDDNRGWGWIQNRESASRASSEGVSGEIIDMHLPALVEGNTTRVPGPLYQHLRVVRSIYEVFEMRPSGEVSREIVVKNDPGAECGDGIDKSNTLRLG